MLAGAGVGLLARFLYLVERYWNVRLRLKLEDRQLRSLIDQVGVENSTSRASLTRALEEVQTVHGVADPRDTLDILQVEAAVVAPTDEGLSDDDLS
ncbi:MAG: hypothetical protein ACXVII_43340, partial [Solirubrobacteraceae bacterium]